IEIDGETYRTFQRIDVREVPAGARWIEGGFALGLGDLDTHAQPELDRNPDTLTALAATDQRLIRTRSLEGWGDLVLGESTEVARKVGLILPSIEPATDYAAPNIVHGRAVHALLTAPIQLGRTHLAAEH